MRKLLVCTLVVVAAAGCSRSSDRGGGTERRDSFTLKAGAMPTTIEAGEERTVSLTVDRGRDFQQNIQLKVEAPTGIASDLDRKEIRPGDTGEVPVKITVAGYTPAGTHTIHVIATPDNGKATSLDIPVTVKGAAADNSTNAKGDAERAFMLKGPNGATTIKRGEAQTVKINVERRKNFDAMIKLRTEAPTGLQASLDNMSLTGSGNQSVNLRITADRAVSLGEHSVRVFGDGNNEATHSWEVKVRVTE
jgi:uncharacterized membrane protein